jgi:hypothetical protein
MDGGFMAWHDRNRTFRIVPHRGHGRQLISLDLNDRLQGRVIGSSTTEIGAQSSPCLK